MVLQVFAPTGTARTVRAAKPGDTPVRDGKAPAHTGRPRRRLNAFLTMEAVNDCPCLDPQHFILDLILRMHFAQHPVHCIADCY